MIRATRCAVPAPPPACCAKVGVKYPDEARASKIANNEHTIAPLRLSERLRGPGLKFNLYTCGWRQRDKMVGNGGAPRRRDPAMSTSGPEEMPRHRRLVHWPEKARLRVPCRPILDPICALLLHQRRYPTTH